MYKNLKEVTILIQNKKFSDALNLLNQFNEKEKKSSDFYFLRGICYFYSHEIKNGIGDFNFAIHINNNNPTYFFYRGNAYLKLNEFDNAEEDYKEAIKLNPKAPEYYNNLAYVYHSAGKNEKSAVNYLKSIELKKNFKQPIIGLLNLLSQTEKINISNSKIILAHKNLQRIKLEYSKDRLIEDSEIKKLIEKISLIIRENVNDLEFDGIQTYKEEKIPPNCNRHKKIFYTSNIIPKRCFSCYKIHIEISNVMELIKLYLVFNKIKLQNNNYRKCLVELRPEISENYKGVIFCESINEAELILNNLNPTLQKNFNKNLKCEIRRGCVEYYKNFPKYNNTNNEKMKYNIKWETFEKNFDEKNPDLTFEKKFNPTIEGITLFDALVFKNWLTYARLVGDETYKNISNQIFSSKSIEERIKLKKNN